MRGGAVEGHEPRGGGAGGGLSAEAVRQRDTNEAVGMGLSQVGIGEEGKLVEVGQTLDVGGGKTLGLHLLPVVGDVVPDMLYLLD